MIRVEKKTNPLQLIERATAAKYLRTVLTPTALQPLNFARENTRHRIPLQPVGKVLWMEIFQDHDYSPPEAAIRLFLHTTKKPDTYNFAPSALDHSILVFYHEAPVTLSHFDTQQMVTNGIWGGYHSKYETTFPLNQYQPLEYLQTYHNYLQLYARAVPTQ